MRSYGRELAAVNVDHQLTEMLATQLHALMQMQALDLPILQTISKIDCAAIVELFYYAFSFSKLPSSTPGMLSLGLELEPGHAVGHAFLASCFVCLKWSLRKVLSISTSEGQCWKRCYSYTHLCLISMHSVIHENRLAASCSG